MELDETHVDGKTKDRYGRTRSGEPPAEKFDMVPGMREGGERGRVKLVHIPGAKKGTIREAVGKLVVPSAERLYTDSASVYNFAFDRELKKKGRSVSHSIEWIVPPGTRIHTSAVESACSLLRRGLMGSNHRISIKHLHRYLSEFETRFNARKAEDRFEPTLRPMLGVEPVPYSDLVAE